MHKFVLTNVVRADIKTAYDVICNPDTYQKSIPQHYPSIRVRSVRAETSVMEEYLNLGRRELLIMAKHVASPPHRHETFVIGGDAKGSHIVHELAEEKRKDGKMLHPRVHTTTITTTVSLKTGRFNILSRMRGDRKADKRSFEDIMDDLVSVAERKAGITE